MTSWHHDMSGIDRGDSSSVKTAVAIEHIPKVDLKVHNSLPPEALTMQQLCVCVWLVRRREGSITACPRQRAPTQRPPARRRFLYNLQNCIFKQKISLRITGLDALSSPPLSLSLSWEGYPHLPFHSSFILINGDVWSSGTGEGRESERKKEEEGWNRERITFSDTLC